MGQAFDQYGDLLGSAEGATKREVFDKLEEAHPNAEEIRIKTLHAEQQLSMRNNAEQAARAGRPTSEWPRDRMLQFFEYTHLPADLQAISRPFCVLAEEMCIKLKSNPERTVMLRKLLEAKDCAVRAQLST